MEKPAALPQGKIEIYGKHVVFTTAYNTAAAVPGLLQPNPEGDF